MRSMCIPWNRNFTGAVYRCDKSEEKEFRATFEIKGKALYPKLDVLFAMMREILMESKLGDEKRLKEILSMLKTRLQTSFLSAGHTTAVLRFTFLHFSDRKIQGYYQWNWIL